MCSATYQKHIMQVVNSSHLIFYMLGHHQQHPLIQHHWGHLFVLQKEISCTRVVISLLLNVDLFF